jgi:hypothetical protein
MTGQDPMWKFTTQPTVEITRNVHNKIVQFNMAYKKANKTPSDMDVFLKAIGSK